MTASKPSADARGKESAFSLLEVMVVLAILAAVLLVGFTAYKSPRSSVAVRGLATEIAAELRSMRSAAIVRNRDYAFSFDARSRTYVLGHDGRRRRLPDEFGMRLKAARETRRQTRRARIVFFADGSSTGGAIAIWRDKTAVRVNVDWLTGAVSVAEASP